MLNTLKTKLTAAVLSTTMVLTAADCHAYRPNDIESDTICTDRVTVTQSVATDWDITGQCMVIIDVCAKQDATDVVIRTTVPQDAELVNSEPSAQLMGREAVWRLGDMIAGDTRQMKLWVSAKGECELRFCTHMSHGFPMAACVTRGCRAKLAIDKCGPEVVLINSDINYQIKVENVGSATAYDVVVTDYVPPGMSHSSGERELTLNIPCIHPGECRTLNLCLQADERGRFCNEVSAVARNASEVRDQACTDIHIRDIVIDKTGTAVQYIGRKAEYVITATNTGDDPLHEVCVTDRLPRGMTVVDAHGGQVVRGGVRWHAAQIMPGESLTFKLSVRSDCIGSYCNQVKVTTCEGPSASDDFQTEYRGHAAIRVEAIDTCDPLMTGDQTCYRINVMNQGTASDKNIRITARLSEHLKPMEAHGDLSGSISGQSVNFVPCEELAPGETVQLVIYAEAMRKGDGRLYIEVTSDMIKDPISEEESTHVY